MEQKIFYFDCFSGISGDMAVAALLDLGADFNRLKSELSKLKLDGFEVDLKRVVKNGIAASRFMVHVHERHHHHHKHGPHHHARNINDIFKIIDESGLSEGVVKLSRKIFTMIAEAEARVHGKSMEEVHFHEVGAVDSIVDIVAFAVCYDELKPGLVIASPVNLGSGTVQCEHGLLPVPAPAVLEIAKGIPVYSAYVEKELTTPTGIAILKAICSEFRALPQVIAVKTGHGAGSRDNVIPNVLRVIEGKNSGRRVFCLETNIDDMNPQQFSWIFPELLKAGALDVFVTPIVMKKNRPAFLLSVLCAEENIPVLEEKIFVETTTIGIRKYPVERSELQREQIFLDTALGKVQCKRVLLPGNRRRITPEYEDCRRIALERNLPLQEVIQAVQQAISKEK